MTGNQADPGAARTFRNVVLVAQTLFGAWFLLHGINYWVHVFPQPRGGTGPSNEFLSILITTGLFAWVKAIEVIVAVALLAHRFVPLAVVVGFPVTLVIVHFNLALNHDLFHTVTGITILTVNGIIALGYMDHFRGLLAWNAGPPDWAALVAWWRDPFNTRT